MTTVPPAPTEATSPPTSRRGRAGLPINQPLDARPRQPPSAVLMSTACWPVKPSLMRLPSRTTGSRPSLGRRRWSCCPTLRGSLRSWFLVRTCRGRRRAGIGLKTRSRLQYDAGHISPNWMGHTRVADLTPANHNWGSHLDQRRQTGTRTAYLVLRTTSLAAISKEGSYRTAVCDGCYSLRTLSRAPDRLPWQTSLMPQLPSHCAFPRNQSPYGNWHTGH